MARKYRPGQPLSEHDGVGLRVGVVVAQWNNDIVERLLAGARRGLTSVGVGPSDMILESVPGSFELPMGARILSSSGQVDAVVCLGCVIRGETSHYELVAENAALGIQQAQLATGIPIAFGVLAVENRKQALARSEDEGGHNVGEEAALVAVSMACLTKRFPRQLT